MADFTYKIEFEGDDPRRSAPQDSPSQKNPAGAKPVQTSADFVKEAFRYEASGLSGNANSAATATFDAVGNAANVAEGLASATGGLAGDAAAAGEVAAATGGAAAAGGAAAGGAAAAAGGAATAAGGAAAAAGGAAAGAGGAAAGAAAGATVGAVGGPPGMLVGLIAGAGMAIGGLGDATDMVIGAFNQLYDSALAVDDTMRSIVEDIKAYSLQVAESDAMYEINEMMAMIHRANVLGPDTAKYMEGRSDLNVAIADMNTNIASVLVPLATEVVEDLATIMQLINKFSDAVALGFQVVGGPGMLGGLAGMLFAPLAQIHAALQALKNSENEARTLRAAEQIEKLMAGTTGFGPRGGPMNIPGIFTRDVRRTGFSGFGRPAAPVGPAFP